MTFGKLIGNGIAKALHRIVGVNKASVWLSRGAPMEPVGCTKDGELGYYVDQYGRLWYCQHRWDWFRYPVERLPDELR